MKSICIFYVTNIIEQFFKYKTDIIIKGLYIYILYMRSLQYPFVGSHSVLILEPKF